MNEKELIQLLDTFLNENGYYFDFLDFAESKGYSEPEIEQLITPS